LESQIVTENERLKRDVTCTDILVQKHHGHCVAQDEETKITLDPGDDAQEAMILPPILEMEQVACHYLVASMNRGEPGQTAVPAPRLKNQECCWSTWKGK
jgi:hypothetical protein